MLAAGEDNATDELVDEVERGVLVGDKSPIPLQVCAISQVVYGYYHLHIPVLLPAQLAHTIFNSSTV